MTLPKDGELDWPFSYGVSFGQSDSPRSRYGRPSYGSPSSLPVEAKSKAGDSQTELDTRPVPEGAVGVLRRYSVDFCSSRMTDSAIKAHTLAYLKDHTSR